MCTSGLKSEMEFPKEDGDEDEGKNSQGILIATSADGISSPLKILSLRLIKEYGIVVVDFTKDLVLRLSLIHDVFV
jgi:hypothetical protein